MSCKNEAHCGAAQKARSPQNVKKHQIDVIVIDMDYDRIKDRREGWTDARSAVGFCLGSGLFGSYNSD